MGFPHYKPKKLVKCTSRSLQIPLLFGTLFCSSWLGTRCEQTANPPQQVNGILGGSVLFPVKLSSAERVISIKWKFQDRSSNVSVQMVTLMDGNLTNTSNRFGQRLDMAGETTLRIKGLEVRDSGLYKAHVRLPRAEIEVLTFNLTVYGPVRTPWIVPQLASNALDTCNVTLQCEVLGKEGLNISWKRGSPFRAFEEGLGGYQLSENGKALHMSWRPDPSDSTFTCLVSNPVDQKSISFDLLSICPNEGKTWMWYLAIMSVPIVVTGLGIWVWRAKRKPKASRAVSSSKSKKENSPRALYDEITEDRRVAQSARHQDQTFIYDFVEIPPRIYDQVTFPGLPGIQSTSQDFGEISLHL